MVESSRHNWSGLDKQTDIQNLNEERILALQLCGWVKKGMDVDVGPFLNSLVQEGEWERAAAVALFNLDIRRAIQILNEGASSEKGIRLCSENWQFIESAKERMWIVFSYLANILYTFLLKGKVYGAKQ